jgi:hypothetical protein
MLIPRIFKFFRKAKSIAINQWRGDYTGSYVAWLSNRRRLVYLPSSSSAIHLSLTQKDWEIATIQPVLSFQRVSGVDDRHSVNWAPIGLLDMLNTGGAVGRVCKDEVSHMPTNNGDEETQHIKDLSVKLKSSSLVTSKFVMKGSGRFGIYSTEKPKHIMVTSKQQSHSSLAPTAASSTASYFPDFSYNTKTGMIEFDVLHSKESADNDTPFSFELEKTITLVW